MNKSSNKVGIDAGQDALSFVAKP